MFEIGSSLREARVRQQLELSDVERATRIRPRYLNALEEEQFDALPGPAYAKGFLRTYAHYLGLDGDRFVDEYSRRHATEEEPAATPPVRIRRRRSVRDRRLLALPVAAALVGLVVWQLIPLGGNRAATPSAPAPPAPTTAPITRPLERALSVARLALVAARGPCWLSVHVGSATGGLVYEQTLEQGRSARFVSKRLWIRIGAPWNLDATLNGKPVRLPPSTGNVMVTPTRLAAAPPGG
jgi:hypothetical protein